MRNLEPGHQPLWRRLDQALESLPIPVGVVFVRGLPLHELLPVAFGFLLELEVLDNMFRGLRDDPAHRVEPFAPSAPGDLVEVPGPQYRRLVAAVLAQASEEDGANRHIDAHAQRVRAANHLEQSALGQLLDQNAVPRQEARVVQPNARPQPPLDVRPVGTGKLHPFERGGDGGFFLTGRRGQTGEILSALCRIGLGEMHHIHRSFALADERLNGLGQRGLGIAELQRNRPDHRLDSDAGKPIEARHLALEEFGLAEGRRHEQETTLGKRQQRHLPCHTALAVGVVVKLVHHNIPNGGIRPVPQGNVGEDFRGAAQDRRIVVDRGVAGAQANIVRTEFPAKRQPLLIHQGLDRAGVDRFASLRQGLEMQGRGHQRFAGSGGRVEDDILARVEFKNRLLLSWIEFDAPSSGKVQEAIQQVIGCRRLQAGKKIVKGGAHKGPRN